VAVRIGHVEIPFSPTGVSRILRMKSLSPQICPACIHVGHVEKRPPPPSHRFTLFQIQDWIRYFSGAKRRKKLIFAITAYLAWQGFRLARTAYT
jgi:hypothetical protein